MADEPFPPRNRSRLPGVGDLIPLLPEDFTCELIGEPAGRPLASEVLPIAAEFMIGETYADTCGPALPAVRVAREWEPEWATGPDAAERALLEQLIESAGRDADDLLTHSLRVGMLSEAIALELGASAEGASLLRRAAVLHDIGKLAVPELVLLKPGFLRDDEYETSKLHTVVGAELLAGSALPVLRLARLLAQSHHERWDGSGYPDRLAGQEIPGPARIVAVADVFDALTHERPYKPAWSEEEAAQELARQRGILHEPATVDALLRVLARAGVPVPAQADRAAA